MDFENSAEKVKLTLASQPEILRTTQRDASFKDMMNFKFLEVVQTFLKYNHITKYE